MGTMRIFLEIISGQGEGETPTTAAIFYLTGSTFALEVLFFSYLFQDFRLPPDLVERLLQ